jgi:hypothetical protein
MRALQKAVEKLIIAPALWRRALSVALFASLAAGASLGCKSSKGSEGLDALEIRGNTPGQISVVAAEVFRNNGYQVAMPGPTKLVFEKEGSRMNNIAYGNWMEGNEVCIRVNVSIVPVSEATYRLEYEVFMVRDKGKMLEDSSKLTSLQTGPYRKLLKQVAARFRTPQPAPPRTAS